MTILYQFADVDFGQDNTDSDDFRSFIQVIPGSIEVANKRTSFPSVSVEFRNYLGVRGRTTTWLVDMIASDIEHLRQFEAAMELYQRMERTHALIQRGITYPRAYIDTNGFNYDGPLVPMQSPIAFGQRYVIHYRILP